MNQKQLTAFIFIALSACSQQTPPPAEIPTDPLSNKGIGPVTSITLGEIDSQKAAEGASLFKTKCSGCHKFDQKYVGPSLGGVTQRRSPEWIMNMILNPQEMIQKDPIAQELLATHYTQMTFQNVSQDDARNLLEFFRQNDSQTK